ncbi:uncharacterized protein LOC119737726 [Patiria miniata]|uniref:Fe2OG dioxygenase domain-containing protein n=1 Tax=Patiria miniata TaxID=46514 RepID=A0A914AXF7_PATMI|nr:uncharacterized protein LOC119737726 [Patiria miniata]
MANYHSDAVADFQQAKKKYKMYQKTLRKIPDNGVLLGKIIKTNLTNCQNVLRLVDSLERMTEPRAFCCGGWVELEQKARLLMHADKKNEFGWPITKLPVEELLEFCTPAPYGDLEKQETVYNSNVRLASECEASKFKFARKSDPNPQPGKRNKTGTPLPQVLVDYIPDFLRFIRSKVSSTLANEDDVTLECYKLNVCGTGGFFSAHVDTPVDAAQMIGTVVVCLPCPHTGGELIVKHRGAKEEFLFAKLSADRGKIQWAAFLSDCVHEILPVKSGHLITITYNIIRKKSSWSESGFGHYTNRKFFTGKKIKADQNTTLANIVSDVLEIAQKKNLKQLGIFLRHKYTMSALAEGNLKGLDQVLCDGLASRGLTCHRLTVLVHEHEQVLEYDQTCGDEDDEGMVYAFSREDMLYVNNEGPKPRHVAWKAMEFIKDWSKGKVVVDRRETEAEKYNCWYTEPGVVDQLYFQSTIVIDIPARSNEEPMVKKGGCSATSGHSDDADEAEDEEDDEEDDVEDDVEDDRESSRGRKRARII